MIARSFNLAVSFYLYLNLKLLEKCFFFRRWVSWSWHNIQKWNGSCFFVSLAAWLSFWRVTLTAGGERRVWILSMESVSFFFPFLLFKYFSWSNAHTHSIKYGAKTTMRKSRRRQRTQFASLDFWISGLKIMFDLWRSFSRAQIWSDPWYSS